MLIALALVAAAPAHAGSAEVMHIYREACVQGALRLTPDRGEVVQWKDMPEFALDMRWGDERREQTTYVRMKKPPRTYVLLTHYGPNSGHLASECIVASQAIRIEDASAAFFEGTPKAHPSPSCYHCLWWDIDVPEKGYRKSLYVATHSKYVVLVTTLYDRPRARDGGLR